MMRGWTILVTAAAVCTALSGCQTANEPVVDRINVDDKRYAQDLEACKQEGSRHLGFSNPIATCLSNKGYRILVGR